MGKSYKDFQSIMNKKYKCEIEKAIKLGGDIVTLGTPIKMVIDTNTGQYKIVLGFTEERLAMHKAMRALKFQENIELKEAQLVL